MAVSADGPRGQSDFDEARRRRKAYRRCLMQPLIIATPPRQSRNTLTRDRDAPAPAIRHIAALGAKQHLAAQYAPRYAAM